MNKYQERAEEWARDFILRYTPDRLPSKDSTDRQERADARKVSKLRQARSGTWHGVFYKSVEQILEDAGFTGLFRGRQERAEDWARGFVQRYSPDRWPRWDSTDPREARDFKRLLNLRRAKLGKGNCEHYPSVEKIFSEAGFNGILDRQYQPQKDT